MALFVRNSLVHSLKAADLEDGISEGFSPTRAVSQGLTEGKICRLPAIGKVLERAEIHCCDYSETMEKVPSDKAFIFLDPPYFEPGARLYATEFDFQEFTRNTLAFGDQNELMITIDTGDEMMDMLSPYRQIVRPVYYPSKGKTVTEQVAVNYMPTMLDQKLKLLNWQEVVKDG